MYKKASWSRTIGFITRLLLFLGYFIASVTVMTHNLGFAKTQCWVQTTYHQEFLVNVVSNPFLSSLNVLRSAPLSKIERKYYNTSDFMQTISSVFAFPTQIQNALHKAAFLTVYPEPVPLVAADELIMVPSSVPDNAYYFNEQNKTVWSTELGPAANPGAAALARGTLDTMLRISGQPPHAGMQLPNLGRCIQPPDKATLQDKQTVTDWGTSLAKLEHYSQRLGTCLLTGQQTTVDVSSNARTSVLLFSSVNVVFMVGIVLWITASFALFNLGGWIKSDMEFSDATSQEVLQGSRTIDCCSCCPAYSDCCGCWPAYSDEVLMIVAVVWNIVPIFLILDRGYRENNNIPLNNAILAISALLVSILVQWKWANFYVYDVEIHEAVAHNIIMRMQDGRAPGVAVKADRSQPKEGGGAAAAGPQEADVPVGKPVKNAVSFSTVNFLSTASMIRDYGMGHAKSAVTPNHHGAAAVKGGLRRRGRNGPFDEEGAYLHASQPVSRRARMGAAMPYYTALVRTGVPFSQYNYTNLIHVSHA